MNSRPAIKNGEMCIMVGDAIKANVSNLCQYTTTPVAASTAPGD
jgi:hypothetical protein